MHAPLTANTRLLGAAEGGTQVAQEPRIDPADAHVQRAAQTMGDLQVGGPHAGGESIGGIVSQADDFFFGIKGCDVANRAEDFLAHYGRGFRKAGPDRRLEPGPFGQVLRHLCNATAVDHRGTIGDSLTAIGKNLLAVTERDHRPHGAVVLIGITHLDAFGVGLKGSDEPLEQRTLHVDALGSQAHLTAVLEHSAPQPLDGLFQVRIGENDAGVLAAQLQRNRADTFGRGLHDDLARAGFTGEGDTINLWVSGEERAGRVAAEAMHHVVHTGWHAGFVHDFGEQRGGGRCLFGRFDHHSIAAGQGRSDLPGHQQQRQIPGANNGDDATGCPHAVVHSLATVRRIHHETFGRHILDQVGEHLEVGRTTGNVQMPGERAGFTGIGYFGSHKLVMATFDAIGHLVQQRRSLGDGHAAPRAFQCRLRSSHGGVDFSLAGLMHQADQAVIGRVSVFEGTGATHPFTIDEMAEFFSRHKVFLLVLECWNAGFGIARRQVFPHAFVDSAAGDSPLRAALRVEYRPLSGKTCAVQLQFNPRGVFQVPGQRQRFDQ
ncbi:hypothetical protein D3C75_533360 [compost metagenome]